MYTGVHTRTGVHTAIKYTHRNKVTTWSGLGNYRVPAEVALLHKVQGVQGVIRFLDYYQEEDYFVMVMEKPLWCKDLFEIITEQEGLEEEVAHEYFKQIVETVIECHKQGVIHGDIKAENIVVDLLTNRTKLIDFGSAKTAQKDFYTTFEGALINLYAEIIVCIFQVLVLFLLQSG